MDPDSVARPRPVLVSGPDVLTPSDTVAEIVAVSNSVTLSVASPASSNVPESVPVSEK